MNYKEIKKQVAQWIKKIDIELFYKSVTEGTKEGTKKFFELKKPGFKFLCDKKKENYIADMHDYFKLMLETRKTEELEDLFIRKLVEHTDTNREFDFFLFHKVDKNEMR